MPWARRRCGSFIARATKSSRSLVRDTVLSTSFVKVEEAAVDDLCAVQQVVAKVRPDAMISHVTSLPGVIAPRRLRQIYHVNDQIRRKAALHLTAAARDHGVKRMIVQSVAFWYTPGASPADETTALWRDAPEPIATSIREIQRFERVVLENAGVVLRCGAFYGPGTSYDAEGSIGRLIRAGNYPIMGHGHGVMSFVHVDDVADASVHALAIESGIYNVADDDPAEARVWIPVFAEALGAPPPRRIHAIVARFAIGSAMTEWLTHGRGAATGRLCRTGWRPSHTSWRYGYPKSLCGNVKWMQLPGSGCD